MSPPARMWPLALLTLACATVPPRTAQPPSPNTSRIEITVTGFESDDGQAMVALFVSEAGWPDEVQRAFGSVALPIRDRRAETEFTGVPPGPVAVSVFHDEDIDGALDQNVLGIPTENYGFSRGARGRFGPPGFDRARLNLAAGDSMQIVIEVE